MATITNVETTTKRTMLSPPPTSVFTLTRSRQVTRQNQLRPLHCVAQEYEWGRFGSSSTVARMKDAQALQQDDNSNCNDSDDDDMFSIDETKPYAELWLGTHPNGMSLVTVESAKDDNAEKHSLLEYVRSDPLMHCGSAEVTDLSFLLKILSVRKVLSIQAHPDKKLAEKLHAERPHIYSDPNHKPEMAIALSEKVRAMCGFRPLTEIAQHLQEYPEFRALIGEETTQEVIRAQHSTEVREVLQLMFHGYIQADSQAIHERVEEMIERLSVEHELNPVQKLMLQLHEQFPGDCGIFAPLIFNIVELNKGEGLFIGANEPHAYVSGEIIECMACSDNVVRAGLTPKLKDVYTLVNMLTYKCCMPDVHSGTKVDDCTVRYQPPVPDFCVERIHVPAGKVYEIAPVASPSVLLTIEGEASLSQDDVCQLDVSFGAAAFLSAHTACTVTAGPYGVQLTRACTNVFYQQQEN